MKVLNDIHCWPAIFSSIVGMTIPSQQGTSYFISWYSNITYKIILLLEVDINLTLHNLQKLAFENSFIVLFFFLVFLDWNVIFNTKYSFEHMQITNYNRTVNTISFAYVTLSLQPYRSKYGEGFPFRLITSREGNANSSIPNVHWKRINVALLPIQN